MEDLLASVLFATTSQGVLAVDESGRVVAANPAAQAIFGDDVVRRQERVGTILPALQLVAPRHGNPGERVSEPATNVMIHTVDGERRDFALHCVPFGRDGEMFTALFLQDVTEPTRADRSLQTLRTQISTNWRLNSLGELAALVAHELNQPLSAIVNYLHIAASRSGEQPDVHGPIAQAATQAQRATETLRRFRALTSRQAVNFESVDANEVLTEILPLLTLVASEADADLRIEVPTSCAFTCDRIQIQQILVNLVRNAAESVRGRKGALVGIRSEQTGNEVLWSVTDNGPGVPEDLRSGLFKPTVSTKADGMGLGLSICKSIVEAHGGEIGLERANADGATFTFRIPLSAAA